MKNNRKKAILGEGLMNFFSLLFIITIVAIVYFNFPKQIIYSSIVGIKQIITSDKVVSDGGITLRNILNTPVDDINLYEFILLNKDDESKIRGKINQLISPICKFNIDLLIKDVENVCFWNLKIEFQDKIVPIGEKYDSVIISPILEGGSGDIIVFDEENNPEVIGFRTKKKFENKFSHTLSLPDYNNNMVRIELNLYKGIKNE